MEIKPHETIPKSRFYISYYVEKLKADIRRNEERVLKRKDAKVFGLISAVFLVLWVVAMFLSQYITHTSSRFNPGEVMSIFMFSAAAVLGFWAGAKLLNS